MNEGIVAATGLGAHTDGNLAMFCELDGVADQVDEHLAQPAEVSVQNPRNVGRYVVEQLQSFFIRPQCRRFEHGSQAFAKIKISKLKFDFAGLDLGEIENVVDYREQ